MLIVLLLIFTFPLFADCPTIGIFTCFVEGMKPWDPDSVHKGIAGSEEAVIYISDELVKCGYHVTVLGCPPEDSPYATTNPRYIPINEGEELNFDIAISWRMPWMGQELKSKAKKTYLWPHDTYHSLLSTDQILAFDGVLWLSDWQRAQWISVNPPLAKFTSIFGNGINVNQFLPVTQRKNPYSCIYGSNYARGLEILLDLWPKLKEQFPEATLDIYYGWQHWGLLTNEKEVKMRKQVADLGPLGVTEHGCVGHAELNAAFAQASFWTYPCFCPEVFCITALRAQISGAIPIIIQGTGLKETVKSGYSCNHSKAYYETLVKAMSEAKTISIEERQKMGDFIHKRYTWEAIAKKWKAYFEDDLGNK